MDQVKVGLELCSLSKYDKAILFFKKAAELNYPPSFGLLVCMDYKGCWTLDNQDQKSIYHDKLNIKAIKSLALQNDDIAQLTMGYMFTYGLKTDHKTALNWYLLAAENQNICSYCAIGLSYLIGLGVEKNHDEALSWFKKGIIVDQINCQFLMGMYYYDHKNDLNEAIYWVEKAARQGCSISQNELGALYEKKNNSESASYWYLQSAKNGNMDGATNIGMILMDGGKCETDYKKGLYWLELAAKNQNARAENALGFYYSCGIGVPMDIKKAVYYYEKSVQKGYKYAQSNLGHLYLQGRGVKQDENQAIYLFEKAANQGLESAKELLKTFSKDGFLR